MIVQKYGGSSVGSPEKIRSVASRIARARAAGDKVVVVVSAMGDTTDELLDLAAKVTPGRTYERELDMLLTAGERISMALLSMALRDQGIEAISFTGSQAGIITDESHTRARILEIRPARVVEELARDRVVIVAGFQGVSRTKEITTLGRGGSDTTAVALAAALGADRCEVYTDVPGIYSADPRLVPGARRYPSIPLELVFEMAVRGAQVMHARSIEIAREKNFPIFVGMAHTKDFVQEGTMLLAGSDIKTLELPKVVSVASRRNLRLFRFPAERAPEVLSELSSDALLVQGVVMDREGGLRVLLDPSESGNFATRHETALLGQPLAALSVIGFQMQQNTQIPMQVLELLKAEGIEPAGLTTHPQSITVWIPDDKDACSRAVRRLHDALIT